MRIIQPRQQLIEIWQAFAKASQQDEKWVWGGRDQPNSVSDAEQLLCLMRPATEIPMFKLNKPNETADDVLEALKNLGDSVALPRRLIRVLTEYMETYTDETGTPIFSAGPYLTSTTPGQEPTATQLSRLSVVDSFAISVTLSLATIGFVRVFREVVRRPNLRQEIDTLERLAKKRLSAAMLGLLRSFTVNVFPVDSEPGLVLCRTVNQVGLPRRQVVDDLQNALREINARLRENVTIGSGTGLAESLENPNKLFECGWSWGIVENAPRVDAPKEVGDQPEGVAESAPYLYFTAVALDGIRALFSRRTRLLGLLDEQQQRWAQALQLRWELTQSYWSTIATFGTGIWPLEDIPWRTTDNVESDYFTLLVTSIVVQHLVTQRRPDAELARVGGVLEELANRSRITRRPFDEDPALNLHRPGVSFNLLGSEKVGGPQLRWTVTDFSPVLLRRVLHLAGLLRDVSLRDHMLTLAGRIWEHLLQRRISEGDGRNLWDNPHGVFRSLPSGDLRPSWYYTRRVIDCLITAADLVRAQPVRNERLEHQASDLLAEAEHLFAQERLNSLFHSKGIEDTLKNIEDRLSRARQIMHERPGTAAVIAQDVLRDLDSFAAARQDSTGL